MNTTTKPTVTDPVCGMKVDPDTAVGSSRHDGQTYYFCSRSCETKFDADPARYLSGGPEPMGGSCCGGHAH